MYALVTVGHLAPPRQQEPQHESDQEQRRDITQEIRAFRLIHERLHQHDGPVHDAGPDGEPDQPVLQARGRCIPAILQACFT